MQIKELNVLLFCVDASDVESIISELSSCSSLVSIKTIPSSRIKLQVDVYKKSELIQRQELNLSSGRVSWIPLPGLISYSLAAFLGLLIAIRFAKKFNRLYHLCIAYSLASTLQGIVILKLGLAKKLVYWANDWFESKTKGLSLEYLYKVRFWSLLDRMISSTSNSVWNLSSRIIKARRKMSFHHPRDIVVLPPMKFKRKNIQIVKTRKIGFLGGVRPGQGLELAIEAMGYLKRMEINAELEIVGYGLPSLKNLLN
jgi:glycosyltransferase involved in cell wall biosynthesis